MFIDGDEFDPYEFQKNAPAGFSGEVKQRKYNSRSPSAPPTPFWKSADVITKSNRPEIDLLEVLRNFRPIILSLKNRNGLRIMATLVIEYEEGDEPRGLFFDCETIGLLNEINAQLDIDAVPLITDNNLPAGIT